MLHGAQIYVNLTARNKMTPPRTLHLQPDQVPEWTSGYGDRVRVLVGRFGHIVSALAPIEPYTIWDVHLSGGVDLPVAAGDNTVIFSLSGAIELEVDGKSVPVAARSAIAFTGSRSAKVGSRDGPAHLLVMSGAGIAEPVFMDGPFIMNDEAGVRAAVSRFHTGQMGFLEPV
jgi:redox-sensitive bicupin YhaK (pirin superfamily)